MRRDHTQKPIPHMIRQPLDYMTPNGAPPRPSVSNTQSPPKAKPRHSSKPRHSHTDSPQESIDPLAESPIRKPVPIPFQAHLVSKGGQEAPPIAAQPIGAPPPEPAPIALYADEVEEENLTVSDQGDEFKEELDLFNQEKDTQKTLNSPSSRRRPKQKEAPAPCESSIVDLHILLVVLFAFVLTNDFVSFSAAWAYRYIDPNDEWSGLRVHYRAYFILIGSIVFRLVFELAIIRKLHLFPRNPYENKWMRPVVALTALIFPSTSVLLFFLAAFSATASTWAEIVIETCMAGIVVMIEVAGILLFRSKAVREASRDDARRLLY